MSDMSDASRLLPFQLWVEDLVDETVLRLEQEALQRDFWPDIGENSAHTFPSLPGRRSVA